MSGFLSGLVPLETETEGFEAPGVHSFDVPPLFEGIPWLAWFDKYMLQSMISVILILVFWLIMARKNAMVPSKGQYLGETAYFFVRNTIARDMIGHDFRRYLPLLIALFSFVLINNLFGRLPAQLAPYALAHRLAVRSGDLGLGDLQRRRHRQARFLWLSQAHDACPQACRFSCGR